MSSTSDSRVGTNDRDPYDAEPIRSDPWATGPSHTGTQDEPTEFVPDQRDSEHDGHLYASDTYAEPETEVLHPDGHKDADTDADKDVDRDAVAEAPASDVKDVKDSKDAKHEPEVETVALPPAEPVAVVEPVEDRPGEVTAVPIDRHDTGADDNYSHDEPADFAPVAPAVDEPVVDEPVDEPAGEPSGELKPGDVPVVPVAGFFTADAVQGLRDRWREAQLGFVDDPRQAVDDVKSLVSEAVDQFTSALSAQRDELDASGEDTEQYRVAVQRYRAFFDRLLGL